MAATLVLTGISASAAHMWQEPRNWARNAVTYEHATNLLYSANELSLDVGGSYFAGQRGVTHLFDTSIKGRRGTWGGDVGLNYFFLRELGVGVDANMADNGGNLVDAVAVNLIGRFPLGNSRFAPYVFGGGGRTTERSWDWMGQAGLGLEFRFNHTVGLFTDGRYQWARNTGDGLLMRAGLRIAF